VLKGLGLVGGVRRLPGVRGVWRERWWLVAFFALATFCRLPPIDGWDEAFYSGQLISIVADRDMRLQDDVVLVPQRFEDKYRTVTTVLPSGALANTFGIGPAVLLSPVVGPAVGLQHPPPWRGYRFAAALGAMLILTVTAFVCTALVRRCGATGDVAPFAVGLALLGSPFAVYGTRFYLNAHAGGVLLVALAAHQALLWLESRRPRHALALGLAVGLACTNRWQDVVVVVPILLAAWVQAARDGRAWRRGAVLAIVAVLLAVSCQLVALWIQYGTPLLIPQGAGYMRWLAPRVVPLVVSTYHGLIPWAPGLALGLLALVPVRRGGASLVGGPPAAEARWLLGALGIGAALAVYVSACPVDWWGRDSYGRRRLSSLAPAGAIGLSLVLGRLPRRTGLLLGGLIVLWATVTVSGHFSGHDDLLALVTGRPDPFRPVEAVITGPAWIDRWGALHALKPGFSFSDTPGNPDRLVGLLFVAIVLGVQRLLLPLVARRPGAQRLLVVLALVHVAAWALALGTIVPANREWDARWSAFLESPLDPERRAAVAADAAIACDVVIAGRAAAASDAGALADALGRLRERGIVVSPAEALRAAQDRQGPPREPEVRP
jgi:hypothetical protein